MKKGKGDATPEKIKKTTSTQNKNQKSFPFETGGKTVGAKRGADVQGKKNATPKRASA